MKELVAALIVRDRRLLLVHNVKHGTIRMEPPGGKRHDNESLEDAVEREAMEELAINVKVGRHLTSARTHSPEGSFIVHMFVCEIRSGEPRVAEPEKIPSFGWYSVDEMERMRRAGTLVPNMIDALGQVARVIDGDG